jgi:hypothetical protein
MASPALSICAVLAAKTVVCAGDTALGGGTVLRYGTAWSRDGITCASSSSGLRCKNAWGHGFFISRGEAYRF